MSAESRVSKRAVLQQRSLGEADEPVASLSVSPPRLCLQPSSAQHSDDETLRLGERLLQAKHVSLDTINRRLASDDRKRQTFAQDLRDLRTQSDTVDGIIIGLLNHIGTKPPHERTLRQQSFVQKYSIEGVQMRTADTELVLSELIEQCHVDHRLTLQTQQVMLSMYPEASTSPRASCSDLSKSPPPQKQQSSSSISPPAAPLSSKSNGHTGGLHLSSLRQWLRKSRAQSESALTEHYKNQ